MHSGDIHEELHPYVYYPGLPNNEISEKSREVAKILDMEFMVRSMATTGAYNCAAISGIPSLLIERGGAGLCLREDIEAYKTMYETSCANWACSHDQCNHDATVPVML